GIGVLPNDPGDVALVLRMACFGVSADPVGGMSCDPASGTLAPADVLAPARDLPSVGTWPLAGPVPGARPPEARMVCVPGGAFLMGDVSSIFVASSELATVPERVVVLSPFAMDAQEMTVYDMATLYAQGKISGEPVRRSDDPSKDAVACTYAADGS